MNPVPLPHVRIIRCFLLAVLCLTALPSRTHAAPANLTQMSATDFATWIMGTEWEYNTKGGKRRIWFATPGVMLYSRPEEKGVKASSGYAWGITQKGEARFFAEGTEKHPIDVIIAEDLKKATVKDPKDKSVWQASPVARRALPETPKMSDAEFKTWLKGKHVAFDGGNYIYPGDDTVQVADAKETVTNKLQYIRPGLISCLWKERPKDITLMIFSSDLKSMQYYASSGTKTGVVGDGAPPKITAAKAPVRTTVKAGQVTMNDLKPIRLVGATSSVNALLVQELGNSRFAGKASTLSISALELEGEKPATIAFNQSVGPMMQKALQEVARFQAIRQGGWPRANEMQLSFEDKYGGKDGPSAAVACALLLESVIKGTELDPSFAVTGDLNADGSVQPIGGVHAKLRGATNFKCKLLGVPQKNAIHVTDIFHTEGLKPFLTIQVFAFSKFDEVVDIARAAKSPEITAAINDFAALAKAAAASPNALRTPDAIAKLQNILQRIPTHLSARILLQFATDKLPRTLSPAGTLAEMDQAIGDLQTAIGGDLSAKTKLDGGQVAKARAGFQRLRPLADPRVRPLMDAWTAWGILADKFVKNNGPRDEKDVQEWKNTVSRINVEEEKLRKNEAFREDLK